MTERSTPEARRNKGPWTHRALTALFTVILTFLFLWLLGFVVEDIGDWPGPDYRELEKRKLDRGLADRHEELSRQINDAEQRINDQEARQELLRDSTANSQRTMNQLLEFQRLSLEKNVTPSEEEQKALAESQQRFLANQRQYQVLNEELVTLNEQLRELREQHGDSEKKLADARRPIRQEHDAMVRTHDIKVAAAKLAVLIPLLLVGLLIFFRLRTGPYAPLVYAFGIAIVLQVGFVLHEYFPTRYFKYVLLLVVIAIVLRILIYLIRLTAFPKQQWLLKQYRESYEAFLCPICSYPIRRGPLKYAFWTRRTIWKMTLPPAGDEADEPYVCPVCATRLYEECESCHAVRPGLLPSCQKCGHTKAIEVAASP